MVAIARALLNPSRLLLIDEPTKGLAPALVSHVAGVLERIAETETALLVEQNLGVVRRLARSIVVLDQGRVVHTGNAADSRRRGARPPAARSGARAMSTLVLLTITGLGLGAMYFLVASGLSLIYGLMGVLNFAHGAFLTVGAYATWFAETKLGGIGSVPLRFLVAALIGVAAGAVFAALTELVLIRPLYLRHIQQVLVTVGLSFVTVALVQGIWAANAEVLRRPPVVPGTTTIAGAHIPNDRWVEITAATLVLVALLAFLRYTRYGLIIRAGSREPRHGHVRSASTSSARSRSSS